ncbi:MAG TPA: SPOR domain-containing protein [Candidatus Limnocylindria bacterium]|nr:SPOR domain-containing protein [Candidatus Limnocylindria bacterium]
MARARGRPSRVGTVFVLIGLVTILGTTFGAGVYTGRLWTPPVVSETRKDAAERPKPPVPPTLTFYQELTAPLTAPPPPRPVKPPRPEDSLVIASRPPAPVSAAPAPPPSAGGYTVQVGAYRARPPADALRATLAAAGHAAEIVESTGLGQARYRVRVGAFATREAARAAAARLAADRTVATFVTTR